MFSSTRMGFKDEAPRFVFSAKTAFDVCRNGRLKAIAAMMRWRRFSHPIDPYP
jgi:hypothetical protein